MRGKWLFEVGIIHDIAVCHLAIFPGDGDWGTVEGETLFEIFLNIFKKTNKSSKAFR